MASPTPPWPRPRLGVTRPGPDRRRRGRGDGRRAGHCSAPPASKYCSCHLSSGPVFDNRRTPAGRQQFALAASDRLRVQDLPETLARAACGAAGAGRGRAGRGMGDGLRARDLRGPGGQGLLRRLHAGEEVVRLAFEHGPIIHRADAIALSREDVVAGAPPIRDWTRVGPAGPRSRTASAGSAVP